MVEQYTALGLLEHHPMSLMKYVLVAAVSNPSHDAQIYPYKLSLKPESPQTLIAKLKAKP